MLYYYKLYSVLITSVNASICVCFGWQASASLRWSVVVVMVTLTAAESYLIDPVQLV